MTRARALLLRAALASLLLWSACAPANAQTPAEPLRVGVLPTLSVTVLLTNYQPLRQHLQQSLKRPVEMLTAKDFATFHRETMGGRYDIVVTAAHFARLAQREAGWRPVATYKAENRAMLLTAVARPIASPGALKDQRLAIANRSAMVNVVALHWLSGHGLQPGRDFRLVEYPSFSAVAHAVRQGEAAMGVVSSAGMRQTPEPVLRELVTFQALSSVPALIWAVNPALANDAPRVQAALLGFNGSEAEAAQFFKTTGYVGLRALSAEELQALDPYADEGKALLQAHP